MKQIFILLMVAISAAMFTGCSDDDNNDRNGNGATGNYGKDLVSKITYEGEDGESLKVYFTYDNNGNLVKTISDWRYEHARDYVIATYERSGNKVTVVNKYGDNYKWTDIYTLNDNGRILVIEKEGDEGDRVTYTYNNVGELIQWERSDGSRDKYIWENGNMIKCIDIDDEKEYNYEYTGEENNMNIEVTQLIERFDYAGYLGNKNLVKTEIYNNNSGKYEYEYEIESGKVISIKQFHIQNGAKELYGTYHIYYK